MNNKIVQLYEKSLNEINDLIKVDGTKLQVSLSLAKWDKLNWCLSVFKIWKRIKNIIIKGNSKEDFISKLETYYNNEQINESNFKKKEVFSKVRASSDNEE